jgi:hypothetical protein
MAAESLTPLSSGAEVLLSGTEADGVADAMIEAAPTFALFLQRDREAQSVKGRMWK